MKIKSDTSQLLAKAIFLLFLMLQQLASAQPGAMLNGTITSAAGEALAGATVMAQSGGATVETTVTNEAGSFVLGRLEVGKSYQLRISSVGYEELLKEISIRAIREKLPRCN